MNVETLLSLRNLSFNPYQILGLSKEAGDMEILEAYQRLWKQAGEDGRSAKRIEEAFLCLQDGRSRRLWKYLSPAPLGSIEEIKPHFRPRPKYLGPGIWMRAIRELNEDKK